MSRSEVLAKVLPVVLLLLYPKLGAAQQPIFLNDKEYFEGPGFSFLLFHNNYQVGFQGGLQMILHGERVLDSGDLLVVRKGERGFTELRPVRRVVNRSQSLATVHGEIPAWNAGYQLICRTDGQRIFVTLKLEKPIDWSQVEQAGLRMALYPGVYFSKSFQGDSASGVFPRQYTGNMLLLGPTKVLRIAQEDPLHSFTISRADGALVLLDTRRESPQSWFMVLAPLAPDSEQTEVHVEIVPTLQAEWRRASVIGISQVGYHPKQPKRVVLELDPRDDVREPARLYQLTRSDDRKLVKSDIPQPWGRFLRYKYATFDFTEVEEPGVYAVEFRQQVAGPFRISADVYRAIWQPALTYFLPVQMCHVAVKEGERTWHGACHLDDAHQAPAGKQHFDGYQQGERETKFADNEHVPGLDWGGWHDAGDHDLPAGSIAITTLALALAQEEFKPTLDLTSIRRAEREVLLHVPDGRQDLLQQVEFGVESLLALYRVAGHVFPGIIENNMHAYVHLGDPVNITDNHIYDPTLRLDQVVEGRSGKYDDRLVFTNRNTGLQYLVAQALAAASRVLTDYRRDLADESLAVARALWDYEQTHPPTYAPNAYAPGDSGYRREEIIASAELLITTGEAKYRQRLLSLLPVIKSISAEQIGEGTGWVLVRTLGRIDHAEFRSVVTELARKWKSVAEQRAASNPYGVPYPPDVTNPKWALEERTHIHSGFVWGHGWSLQEDALQQYYFHKHLPEMFSVEPLLSVVNFVLGCHPANNQSYVSGVGANSPIIAYGFNRADWSHIPGGVISGASLVKPDFMELKEFPFLWYQTEYVIGGAATYIFDVLAADKLLNE